MNTFEIEKTVARDKCLSKYFLGVFPSDKLPKVSEIPCCFIANTDPSNEPGMHWVALFFDTYVEYFDSYGLEPFEPFRKYNPEVVNTYCFQSIGSKVCGEYCIYYLYMRSRRIPFETIVTKLKGRNNTDKLVKSFVDKLKVSGISEGCQSCTCRNEGC